MRRAAHRAAAPPAMPAAPTAAASAGTSNAGWTPKKMRPMKVARAGGKRHRQEGAGAELRHHQFDREHHAADRRVEGGGDAGAGAGGDQRDALPRRHPDDLAERGAERRADLDDRALRARRRRRCRSICAEASDLITATTAGSCPPCSRSRPSPPGTPWPRASGREICHQEGDDQAADDRNQDDERRPTGSAGEDVGVVVDGKQAEKGDVVDQRRSARGRPPRRSR